MQNNDNYGIYHTPAKTTIIAVICAGAALFFGSWALQLKQRVSDDLRLQMAMSEKHHEILLQKERELFTLHNELRDTKSELRETKLRLEFITASTTANLPRQENVITPQESAIVLPVEVAVIAPSENTTPTPIVAEKSTPIEAEKPIAPIAAEKTTADELAEADILSGEILTYNPDNQRVYLSLGSANAGVQPGNRFSIWRSGEYVTEVEVLKVFSVTSTCKVAGGTPIGLQVGDIAKRARPVIGAL